MELFLVLMFISLVSFLLFFLSYKHRSRFSSPNLPPGGIGFPIVGESIAFLATRLKGRPEKFITDRMSSYSHQCFKTSLLCEPVAVMCGAAGNKLLFSNENKLVVTWFPSAVNSIFPTSLQSSASEEGHKLRKILLHILRPETLKHYIENMDMHARHHFAAEWENKDRVNVLTQANHYAFWFACRLFVGIDDPVRIHSFSDAFQHVATGIFSVPINLPGTPFRRAVQASKIIKKEIRAIIKQRKIDLANGVVSATHDILSRLLVVTDDDGVHINEADIEDKILGLLVGGHDTISVACTFVVKYLAELPEIYERVHAEQMDIAKSKSPGELLNWDDIQKMRYSWNVVREVMRLTPVADGQFREAIKDIVFNGFFIPKGWKLYWSAHSTHKNPEYFPAPEKFDPLRFEGTGPAPFTYVPFGGGPRMCPGNEYAKLIILVFIHNLVKRFKWEKLLPDESIVVNPLPKPTKGLPIRLYAHKP